MYSPEQPVLWDLVLWCYQLYRPNDRLCLALALPAASFQPLQELSVWRGAAGDHERHSCLLDVLWRRSLLQHNLSVGVHRIRLEVWTEKRRTFRCVDRVHYE